MNYDLQDSIALLERTPAALNALLRGLPDTWTQHNEGPDSWTVYDVIGHLVHAEQKDWMQRIDLILQHGDTRPFEPFDRESMFKDTPSASRSTDLLDDFAQIRAENLTELRARNLQPRDFDRPGRHPALGAVTLGNLIATWAVHDLSHLHQISRVMAYQHREAVGPWTKFLGVLKCEGHSA